MIFARISKKLKGETVFVALLLAILATVITSNLSFSTYRASNDSLGCEANDIACMISSGAPIPITEECKRQGFPLSFQSSCLEVNNTGRNYQEFPTKPTLTRDNKWEFKVLANIVAYWIVFSSVLFTLLRNVKKKA